MKSMNKASASSANTPRPTPDQIKQNVTSALTAADDGASQTILNLNMVHKARLSQLTRTAVALKAQYGADNAIVKEAEAAVASRKVTVARITAVHEQIATPAPPVASIGWALHGRVFSSTLQPEQRFTVFLVDGQKTYQEQYGFTYTDSTGYFLISYAGSADTAAVGAQQPATPQLYIEIANASGKPIYLSTTAFQPAAGSTTYQNITVPAGAKPIGDPPSAIRKVAMPKAKRS
jgi:hypothetical protein